MLQLGLWMKGASGARGLPLAAGTPHGRDTWEARLLNSSLADWHQALDAPPQRIAAVLGGTTTLPSRTRITHVDALVQLALVSQALKEADVGLTVACLQQLGDEWLALIEPLARSQLAVLMAPYSAAAYRVFGREFGRFLELSATLDLAQMDDSVVTSQRQLAEMTALCARTSAPLVSEGAQLLADALAHYKHACRYFDESLPWLRHWTGCVSAWQTHCSAQLLHKARLERLYHYLRGLHDSWVLSVAASTCKRPEAPPGADEAPPYLVTPTSLKTLLGVCERHLPELARVARVAAVSTGHA